jgi:hypothetical protein
MFKYVSHATVVETVGRYREKLNELQTDATGYKLAEVIWRSRNEAGRTWWFFRCPRLKYFVSR